MRKQTLPSIHCHWVWKCNATARNKSMPTNDQIDAPETLTGLFPADSDDDDGENDLGPCFEVQSMELAGETLLVRQFDYHSHNANRVWPGTFNLAEYLVNAEKSWGNILELGTATGLLAMRLCKSSTTHHSTGQISSHFICDRIVTSDVQDERNEIQENLLYNYRLNQITNPPPHVPHTWGTGWLKSVVASGVTELPFPFDTVIASDILLYVSAYPALVVTLSELMPPSSQTVFVMSWNRRMKESADFFEQMKEAGFHHSHEGKCIYVFTR